MRESVARTPIKKWAKVFHRHFSKAGAEMAKTEKKKKKKSSWSFLLTPLRMDMVTKTSVSKDVGTR